MRDRIIRLAMPFLVLVLVCSAMGSPAVANEVIHVGAVQALTGPVADAAIQLDAGLRDCLMMANEKGGINGKKIRYVMEDGHFKPDIARAAFEKIISRFKPLVVFGENTFFCKALAPEIRSGRYKILLASPSFSSELADRAMNPSIFVPGPTFGDQFAILLKFIARQHLDRKPYRAKVAFFYSDSGFGRDPINYGRMMCNKLRINLVAEKVVKMGAADIAAEVKDLKEKDPDYVIVHGFIGGPPVGSLIKQCRDLGMNCTFMGTCYGTTEMLLQHLGPLAEGYHGVNPYCFWSMENVPMIKKIRAYTASHYPDVKFRPSHYMVGFVTGLVFVEVLRRADSAGQLNHEGLVKALQGLKDFDTGGLTAPFTIRSNRFPVARIWKANVEKGIFEPASDWIDLYRYLR